MGPFTKLKLALIRMLLASAYLVYEDKNYSSITHIIVRMRMVNPNQSMENYQNYSHLNGRMSTAFLTSGPSCLAKFLIILTHSENLLYFSEKYKHRPLKPGNKIYIKLALEYMKEYLRRKLSKIQQFVINANSMTTILST